MMLIISMYWYACVFILSHDLCPDVHLLCVVVAPCVLNRWCVYVWMEGCGEDVLDVYACILMDARASGCRLDARAAGMSIVVA